MTEDGLILPERPTIQDYQAYISKLVKVRWFDKESLLEIMLLMMEEVGELAKVVRKTHGLHTDPESMQSSAEDELADVFIYPLDVANILGVDLEKAFRNKEAKNKKRTWNKGISDSL